MVIYSSFDLWNVFISLLILKVVIIVYKTLDLILHHKETIIGREGAFRGESMYPVVIAPESDMLLVKYWFCHVVPDLTFINYPTFLNLSLSTFINEYLGGKSQGLWAISALPQDLSFITSIHIG